MSLPGLRSDETSAGVIPVLVTGIQHAKCSSARVCRDTGDKPRYDISRLEQAERAV
jgi:hypothetical protein